jgi:hypothetical protein
VFWNIIHFFNNSGKIWWFDDFDWKLDNNEINWSERDKAEELKELDELNELDELWNDWWFEWEDSGVRFWWMFWFNLEIWLEKKWEFEINSLIEEFE